MNRYYLCTIAIVTLVSLGLTSLASEVKYDVDSFFSSPRRLATGDVGMLYPYDGLLFLENPGILSFTKMNNFFITKVSICSGASAGYLYNTLNLASYNLSPIEWIGFDWAILTNELMKDPYGVVLNSNPEVALFGPLCFGYVGNGIGIMIYNDFSSSIDVKQAPGIPYVELKSFAEIGITLGFGTYFEISKFYTLHTGISLSYAKRYKSPFFYGASPLEIVYYYENIPNKGYEYDVSDSFWGDIGLILDDGGHFKYALTLNNFFGRKFYWTRVAFHNNQENIKGENYESYIPPSLSLGAMFHLEKIPYIPTLLLSDFMIELNLVNLLKLNEYWFKKVKLGSEISILKIFKLRGGINQGCPTFGLGIDLLYVVLDLSFSQYEKGVLPGQESIQNVCLSLEIKM